MPRVLKHFFAVMLVVIIAGCSGAGCGSGCAGCGVTPLAEGFDRESRVENGGAVRLTQEGMAFIEANLGPLAGQLIGGGQGAVLTFEVPSSSGSEFGISFDVCPGGPDPNGNPATCLAEIDVGNAQLAVDTTNPHNIHITGPMPVRIQDLPIHITYFGFIESDIDVVLHGDGDGVCPGDPQSFAMINLDVDISIEIDSNPDHSRYGYSRVKVNSMTLSEDNLKDSLHFCGGFDAAILEALKSILFGVLVDPLIGTLTEQIDSQLCQKANPELTPVCPNGTNDVEGICRYGTAADAECASIILGTDGHAELGQLLAGVSPGTKGALDFVLAAGGQSARDDGTPYAFGDLNPIGGGATLGMYGGVEPTPISGCVPFSDMALPTGIPIPDELLANDIAGWPADIEGPHVGIALSERFMNYALNGMYNSGLLCIGVSTETVALLSSGTIGLLAGSMKDLGLQRETAQVAVVIRPQAPPSITFGNGTDIKTDPSIRIKLPNASFDFYFWSLDRFIRVMTATFDLDVPMNLTVTPEGLAPVIEEIGVDNGKVTNTELLREDPATIASALGGLIGSQVGQALGSGLPAIDLNDSLAATGLTLTIPESIEGQGSPGLRKLTKGSDNYLGIFATLGVATAMAQNSVQTGAELVKKDVDHAGLRIATMTKANAPLARIHMTSPEDDGTRVIEYSYRVDQSPWHPWTRERFVDVRDEWLRLQGRHVIAVRARLAGQGMTVDRTPALVEVVVDAEPPVVKVGQASDEGTLELRVDDAVTEAARVRTRLDDGTWSPWATTEKNTTITVGEADTITIEAEDEEGNITSTQQAIIRGRAAPGGAACGCSVPGSESRTGGTVWLLAIAVAGVIARLARKRTAPKAAAPKAAAPKATAPRTPGPARSRMAQALGGVAVMAVAGSWTGCSCGEDETNIGSYSCIDPCVTLEPGLIGAYTSTAVSGDTLWVAGYAEADWNNDFSWGDLVVGKWNGTTVDWVAIDGVPAETPVDPAAFNTHGFRGGQTEPGDDVGLWTSIAIDGSGNPAVAYYDRGNKALRFARLDGAAWVISVVEGKVGADIGRYAKLLFLEGNPVIAYLTIEPGTGGKVTSKVRVATAATPKPTATDWKFEDAVVDPSTPCRAAFCSSDTVCVKATGVCAPELADDQCPEKCAGGTACVAEGAPAACVDVFDKSRIDSYPEAVGDYVSIAPDGKGGIGIAYYDRVRGNLGIATKSGSTWTTTIVDGQAADGTDTGDVGMGASLAIDSLGDWHVAYTDGFDETVRYLKIGGGAIVEPFEVVDDGLSVDGAKFEDGHHIVGDDSKIVVTPSGEIHITYQDATAGKLHYAVGTPAGDAHDWSVRAIDSDGFAGAFSSQVEVSGQLHLVHWWRKGGESIVGDVAVVRP